MLARSRTVAEPRWSPDGRHLAWVEAFAGRADVFVAPADGSGPPLLVTAGTPVASVGAYGGGAYAWADAERLVVAASDGRLVLVPADGVGARTLSAVGRAAAPACPSPARWVAFARDGDDRCEVVVAPLEAAGEPAVLSTADYAWDPACSPDGALVAWHEWDLPNMPWDGSRIVVAAPDGGAARVVAGGDGESVGQPRWSPDGRRLGFVTDRDGWWNVWSVDRGGGDARPVLAESREQAEPAWGPGQRSFAWSPDGTAVALVRNEDGFGRLVVAGPDGADLRARGWHHGLDWGDGGIAAARSGARTPTAITVLGSSGRRVVARGPVGGFETVGLTEPEPVTWAGSDGTTVPGLLWRPTVGSDSRPPLLVDVHGGPTGQATAAWRPAVSFFTSRGWAVLAPNPTGSTGYGRAYAQALAGEWGARDVDDVAAGIHAAAARGWGDPERVAVSGGSAGALTVLLLCVRHPDLVRAAVSQYGVTDLAELAATTHRFESRYLDRLVGVLPRDAARYRERSPATHAAALRVPVLVLHGRDDRVVPVGQAEALVRAIEAAGGTVECHLYDGEGHGWRLPDTIEDVYRRMDAFLDRHVADR